MENIDGLESKVNLYYDDEGWIVAYLDAGEASALVLQARNIDSNKPEVEEIGDTILLSAIKVVVEEALKKSSIESDTDGLGHYHWQFADAENFLIMAVARQDSGEYPVQFAVPAALRLWEVSASLWIAQGHHEQAPCARVTLDEGDLVAKKCVRGIYSGTVDLDSMGDTVGHTWKLIQSERSEGSSGSLMVIIYGTAAKSE